MNDFKNNSNGNGAHSPLLTPEKAVQLLKKYANEMMGLSMGETDGIADFIDIKAFEKGRFLLKEGQYLTGCFFVFSGCVREYYLMDGEERTTAFYTEQQPVTSTSNSNLKTPVKFNLECIEDTIVSFLSTEKEAEMFKRIPRLETLCRIGAEEIISDYQNMLASYMVSSPEERYLNLLETRPELLNRVPQYQLASYLGVKPESLSRIRRRILQKQPN